MLGWIGKVKQTDGKRMGRETCRLDINAGIYSGMDLNSGDGFR